MTHPLIYLSRSGLFDHFSLVIVQGSFGQVVCAYDQINKMEVAVKIIKSRKPFLIQAKTEIDILNKVNSSDTEDDSNIVRLLDHFMYRNHQCLVFEILSFNLYELLKNTKYVPLTSRCREPLSYF